MAHLKSVLYLICCGILQFGAGDAVETVSKELMVTNVERSIDIASQLVKINTKLTLSNEGQSALKFFHFTVEEGAYDKTSYIGASVSNMSVESHGPLPRFWCINNRDLLLIKL